MNNVEFLKWHPSSASARLLESKKDECLRLIKENPEQGIQFLVKQFKFGKVSELWDDHVFNKCIRPVLENNASDNLEIAVNRYSALDHALFTTYIRREEDPSRFRRAFWHVNCYGLSLAVRLKECLFPVLQDSSFRGFSSSSKSLIDTSQKIAFILKGPFKLAHCEFLLSFLKGCAYFRENVKVDLILLDEPSRPKGIEHINVISLAQWPSTFDKLKEYYRVVASAGYQHVCWVACVQNLSLFMGAQLAERQGYWSMKYHSIIMPSIQKYAGLGFGGKSFVFDTVDWFRGRAFPELSMKPIPAQHKESLLTSAGIPSKALVVGCFVRSEKLHSLNYWRALENLLAFSTAVHIVIASQDLPFEARSFLSESSYKLRFHHIGWVNTKQWAYALDLYFDSAPRGSCNTIFEAIEAGVPVIMTDTEHNRESSALPYLQAAGAFAGNPVPGVSTSLEDCTQEAKKLIASSEARHALASQQLLLLKSLKGRSPLFAKDYLNYFLDASLSLVRI